MKTWFDQPGRKKSRRVAREQKAGRLGVRPTELLRPAVRAPTLRYNRKLRSGRGFTFDELKAAGIPRKQALSIGIAVDHRRRNRSEESLKLNADRLKAYKDRLILFPRNAKKPKKGDSEVRRSFPLLLTPSLTPLTGRRSQGRHYPHPLRRPSPARRLRPRGAACHHRRREGL